MVGMISDKIKDHSFMDSITVASNHANFTLKLSTCFGSSKCEKTVKSGLKRR